MKLSFIFELILIFVLIAFAASAAIDKKHGGKFKKGIALKKNGQVGNKRQEATANRYCSCSTAMCNCCREFNIPVVALRGPGCATLQYLTGDRLAISMSFGERVLTNTTVSSKRADPICMPLPGGVTKFCGRVYNIGRKNENFNACLGLELRSSNEVEAAMRVSCFRFGPDGLKLEPPQPLPVVEEEDDDDDDDDDEDDDDDDDDDDFAFDDDDDDEEYDEDDGDDGDDDSENDVDSDTFSLLDSDFIGGYFEGQGSSSSSGNKKRKATTTTTLRTPLRRKNVASTPTKHQLVKQNVKPVRKVAKPVQKVTTTTTTKKPTLSSTNVQVSVNNVTLPENQNITMSLIMSPSVDLPKTPVDSTTISTEMPLDTTIITTTPNEVTTNTTVDEEEEDDPLAEAVEDVITDDGKSDEEASEEDSDESSEASTEKTVDLTTAKTKINKKEEDGDVFDEIADGVAETMGVDDDDEDDSDESRKSS